RHTITIYSNATYDGYAFSASSSALPDPNPDEWGDGSDSTSLLMYVGEYSFFRAGEAFNFRNRSFLAFPLDSIPAGAIILSATLYINLNNNTATVDDVGDCIIDHIGNYTPLDRTDYQIVPLTANIATLATPATLPGLLSIPGLESYVQDDLLNSRPYTHFRLRQSTGGDTPTEATPSEREIFRVYNFTTGDSIVKPYLEIIYSRPPNPPINLGVQGFADGTEEALNITSHTPTLNWTFSDPDAGDTQSAYNVSVIRVSDGVLMWFKNDTGANNTVIYNETGGGIAALELIDCNDYYFRVQTQDNHGLWGDWAEMRFHMNTLPTTMLVAPANDTWINDNTPLFDWDYFDVEGSPQCAFNLTISSNSDFSTIDYYYESAPSYSDTYYDWPSALPDGIWYWRVKTNDSYEWGEWSEYFIMKIDTVLPTSTIETPFVDPAYYKTSPIWLNGTCLDDRSGINRMEIKIVWKDNGTIYLDWRTTNLAANYSWWDYSFQPPNEANFTIYIRAVDNASNYQVAITRNVTYDITLPTSTIETPFADPAYYNTAPISLDGTCSDTLSGINRVEIKIIWKDNGTIYLDWSNANLAADYSWWDYSFEPPNGANFTIYVRAVDNASNYQVAITRNVTYDITLPTSTIETPSTDPAYYNTVPIWLDGACSDALSGINRVEIKIIWKDNGTIYLDWSNANLAADYSWWDYSFEPPNGANFTIYVRAVDNASNYQNAIIRNVTYDVTAPTAHVDPLPEYSNSNFLVSWSGSDTLSGVSYYTVKNSTDPL
ncbi:MAG: Ig-like domain repeat protein, partial [Candidatus Thermoplasmatota archaeon]